jgi:hypothetical protein
LFSLVTFFIINAVSFQSRLFCQKAACFGGCGGGKSGPGDSHGRAPLFRPVITFLPSRHSNKVDRFINRRGIIGLVGFAVQSSLIRTPLDRFRFGLMAEIPARENFKNTKTSKTS